MAEVWLARLSGTRGFRKIVAIKTILRGAIDDARMEQMFIEEATLASQIHHPNTVEILDFGDHEGTLYIAMEWVEGEPLNVIVAEAQKQGGLPLPIAVNVLGQACKGLHAAHELCDEAGHSLGIVHRDISPQNLIVSYTGTVKVLDFGIAKATSQVSTLTEAGEVKGKFAYMSPEQVSGGALDRRSDIFALAVLGYMLTTGRHPFRGENSAETVRRIYSPEPALAPSSFIPNYPKALESALLRALEKKPDNRFQTAHDFLSALEDVAAEYLENSFEVKLAEYMRGLLGERQAERRRKLRVAEESAGKETSGVMNASTSNGSLGAVSIDGGRATGSNASARLPALSEAGSGSLPAGIAPARGSTRWLIVAPAVSLALVASGFFLSRTLGTAGDAHKSPASRVVSEVASAPLAPSAPLVELTAQSLPSAAPPAALAEGRETEVKTSAPTAPAPRVRGKLRGPVPHATAKTEAPASAPVAAPAAPSVSAPSPSSNSWDRSTFGGRY
jgi:serine/threonine-protein kinase